MLNRILNQALDQYVFDRVDQILRIAGAADEEYMKAANGAETALSQLMTMARKLEAQHPELIRLVTDYEAAANFESSLATEIVNREGIRDSCGIRQEFGAFMQQPAQGYHEPSAY